MTKTLVIIYLLKGEEDWDRVFEASLIGKTAEEILEQFKTEHPNYTVKDHWTEYR